MPTQARSGYGTQLLWGPTVVPEMRNLSPVGFAHRTADVSAHDGNGWSSLINTIKDGKPITAELNWIPTDTTHAAILAAALTDVSYPITVRYPTTGNPEWTCNVFVTDFTIPGVPVEGALALNVILTPDGAMTFTP